MSPSPLAAPLVLPKSYNTTLGALLVGGLINAALWGVTCVQTYNYYVAIRNTDRRLFRLLIGFMWCLSTLDTIMGAHTLYHYMVIHFADPLAILAPIWCVGTTRSLGLDSRAAGTDIPGLMTQEHNSTTSLSNLIIRILFAHRVYRLSKGNLYLTGWILAVSGGSFGVGIAVTAKVFTIQIFPQLSKYSHLLYVMFAVSTAADLSIMLILTWLLRHSRSGYTKTDGVIKILMMYTVNTGVVVAVDATVALVTYVAMPNNFIFISKLYFNAYLATLNAREMLRTKADSSIQLSSVSGNRRTNRYDHLESQITSGNKFIISKPGPPLAISVQTLVDQKIDVQSAPSPSQYYTHAI
ncbi:hypothetical protein D9619_013559 [Psilocybe cf. subviscida]|uniref:DUF6534 domain-containing protein n=1 Tax=Psilocybe cf. subviscida TaxID=2480587 RepID=A0A8H5AQ38_9AGAR|nr:hypothetical protein D9619_013559 [Psilocybe cf. subviscida]